MLRIFDPNGPGSRRAFLQVGSLALGGLSLSSLLEVKGQGAEGRSTVSDKSVIFLFLHGGPSQIETFDPKMSAPVEFRSATGEIPTRIPGVTFGGSFPRLAALADKLAIIRSFVPGDSAHNIKPVVCRETFGANLGSVYARVAGTNHPDSGLPANVLLFPRAVDPSALPGVMGFGRFDATGPFGTACSPFDPSGGGPVIKDMNLSLSLDRLEERRLLVAELDRVKWALAESKTLEGLSRLRQQAFHTLLRGAGEAFDLAKEDARTLSRYDTAPLVRPDKIDKKWNNHKNYADHSKALGKLLLLARRLCERGCGFVTVTTSFVWDMHADANNAGMAEGMGYMGLPLDHALSAFIEDVEARGLSSKILLVVCGEMGRTPRLNNRGGRDHWGNLGPLLLYGGGLHAGRVIGQSDRHASEPHSEPIQIRNLLATILHTLFDVGKLRVVPGVPREIGTMAGWEPIPGLHT